MKKMKECFFRPKQKIKRGVANSIKKINYHDICPRLKRYSFEEKMGICNKYSSLLINERGNIDVEDMIDKVYPWELETFTLMSIKATPEYQFNTFSGNNEYQFIQMINGIRDFEPAKLEKYRNNTDFLAVLLSASGLNQFDIQGEQYIKLYRARYIYNFKNDNLDLKSIFIDKFGCEYADFLECCGFLTIFYGSNGIIPHGALEFLINGRFLKACTVLSITTEQYKERLDAITKDIEDYTTCLRPSYQYPFVQYKNKVYIPLPHLLIKAGTESLMYRLTEGNNELRRSIGKEVLEDYLYKLLDDAQVYDEVYPEQEYFKEKRQSARTVDIMARYGTEYLFLDSKSSAPSIGMRIYDIDAIDKKVQQLVKAVKQIYRQITVDLPKYNDGYNPFNGKPVIDREHIWAAVVAEADSYVLHSRIEEMLKNDFDSKELQWINQHIKIISLYDVERYSVVQKNLISGFENDFHLELDEFEYCPAYDEFLTETSTHYHMIIDELQKNGFFSNNEKA